MQSLYFLLTLAISTAVLGISFIIAASVWLIILRQNQCLKLNHAVTLEKKGCKAARVSINVPYLQKKAENLSSSKSGRDYLKQAIRWDFLMLAICTKCFDKEYTFYTNTWVLNRNELNQLENLGFKVNNAGLFRRLSAKFVTAISFWRLHKSLNGLLKLIIKKKCFYTITWNSEAAFNLHRFLKAG